MSADAVSVSLSSLMQFTKSDTPDYALDLAMRVIDSPEKYGRLTNQKSKKLVECATIISGFDEQSAEFSRTLMEEWGVDNAAVIRRVPEIILNYDLADALLRSGMIHVPNENGGDEVRIDEAGATEVELALGISKAEQTLRRYSHYRNNLEFSGQLESTSKDELIKAAEEFILAMKELPSDGKYHIRFYIKTPKTELTNQKTDI